MKVLSFFSHIGSYIKRAFNAAKAAGLTDQLVQIALPYIREANRKFVDNDRRREWVVSVLMARKVPESIARLVTELAFQVWRKELQKAGI